MQQGLLDSLITEGILCLKPPSRTNPVEEKKEREEKLE